MAIPPVPLVNFAIGADKEDYNMEKEQETIRKKMIKRVAAVFLVAMLILTFFSNTIMNYSLPEVATERVLSGTVSNKVRGQGTVETNSEYEVVVSGARVIKEIKVSAGDEVKEGQVLFTFEDGENSELTQEQDALEQMELEYAKSLLKTGPDYRSDNQEIEAAKEELKEAVNAQEKATADAKALTKAKKDLEAANQKVGELTKQIEAIGEAGDYSAATDRIKETEKSLAAAKVELSDLQEDLKMIENGTADGSVTELKRAIRDKEKAIADLETDLKDQKTAAENLKTANATLTKLQADLTAWQTKASELSAKVEELKGAPTPEQAKKTVKEKKLALENAQYALKSKKKEDSISQQIANMDQQASLDKIEEQRQKVEKLEKSDDIKEVKAKEAGVISEIACKVGDSVSADIPLAKIQMADSGYIVKITVSKEKSKLIRIGDEATVENIWDDGVSASVKTIRVDTENPNQNMVVVFEVKGNVNPGQTLAFAVGEKSNRYDTIVPNSAVREDSKGKFVLVVTEKSTPLGNRYKIKRAEVEVMASDDTMSGVSGSLSEYEDVVTNASRPLEEGMQVRLKKQ